MRRRRNGTSFFRNCCLICWADRIIVLHIFLDNKFKISLSKLFDVLGNRNNEMKHNARADKATNNNVQMRWWCNKCEASNIRKVKIQLYLAIYLGRQYIVQQRGGEGRADGSPMGAAQTQIHKKHKRFARCVCDLFPTRVATCPAKESEAQARALLDRVACR